MVVQSEIFWQESEILVVWESIWPRSIWKLKVWLYMTEEYGRQEGKSDISADVILAGTMLLWLPKR